MTLMINLSPEEEARLKAVARQQGIDEAELARRVLTEHLPQPLQVVDAENASLIALLQSWNEEDATSDPIEIAARDRDWEEMEANLKSNRVSLPIPQVD